MAHSGHHTIKANFTPIFGTGVCAKISRTYQLFLPCRMQGAFWLETSLAGGLESVYHHSKQGNGV